MSTGSWNPSQMASDGLAAGPDVVARPLVPAREARLIGFATGLMIGGLVVVIILAMPDDSAFTRAFAAPTLILAAVLGPWFGPRAARRCRGSVGGTAALAACVAVLVGPFLVVLLATSGGTISLALVFAFGVFGLIYLGPIAFVVVFPVTFAWAGLVQFLAVRADAAEDRGHPSSARP